MSLCRHCLLLVVLIIAVVGVSVAHPASTINLVVDATKAPEKILHVRLSMPVKPGPLTLYYPKWIPGEHSPSGPLFGLAGVKITAGGAPVEWRRDPIEMFAFHVDVPPNATAVDVDLDYLGYPGGAIFSAGASASSRLAVLSWNSVLLYPAG